MRPPAPLGWNDSIYVGQWLNGTRQIHSSLQESCPELLEDGSYGYLAPSFANMDQALQLPRTWAAGLETDEDVTLVSVHK